MQYLILDLVFPIKGETDSLSGWVREDKPLLTSCVLAEFIRKLVVLCPKFQQLCLEKETMEGEKVVSAN